MTAGLAFHPRHAYYNSMNSYERGDKALKCRMFALSLALGALLCLAPSAAALEPQPEVPAPDTAAASQTDTPAAPAEEAAPALTEEVTKEVTVTVEVPILPEKPPIQISYTTPEEIGFAWEEDGLELEVAEVLPAEEISLAPDPDADASAPEAPADSDDTNGTEAAAASDAPAQAPHTEAPAAAQPAAPAVPTLPQTGTTGWMAGVLASLGSLLLACGWFFTRKSKHS